MNLSRNIVVTSVGLAIALVVACGSVDVSAQEFFKGKTIRIIVGFAAGGGFDIYSRTIARHMAKHIPGSPTIIVENMTGAGSMIAANYMYNRAAPDGLTIGNFNGALVLQQVLGSKGIQFDARKFEWIGVPVVTYLVCVLSRESGIKDVKVWVSAKQPVKLGGVGPGSDTSSVPRVLSAALGLPIRLVEGYKGVSEIKLATDSKEVDGGCGWAWTTAKGLASRQLESGELNVVLQLVKKHPELPNVPNAIDLATTDEARQLIKYGIDDMATITRFYSLPPGTPKDTVVLLRRAFMNTMKDVEFLSDAEKSKLEIDPIRGEEVEKIVAGVFSISPGIAAKLSKVLVPEK